MPEKVYLYLFIICVILAQGIFGTFLNDDTKESSDVLNRRKRVINRNGDVLTEIGQVPYVVNIRRNNRLHCIGTILSKHTVITAARCTPLNLPLSEISILSGKTYSYVGENHSVIDRKLHGHNLPKGSTLAGISLLITKEPFNFNHSTGSIDLHIEPVLEGMIGTVSGWGTYLYGGQSESDHRQKLRSITVPIMNHKECANIYRGIFPIGDEEICTYDNQKQCAHTDAGAGLVMKNKLVGVYIGTIGTEGKDCPIRPDVFVFLQHLEYGEWIRRNIVY